MIVGEAAGVLINPGMVHQYDHASLLRGFHMPDRVIITIGTKKGLFVAQAPKSRRSFALNGPAGAGVAVYATLIDKRGTPRLTPRAVILSSA